MPFKKWIAAVLLLAFLFTVPMGCSSKAKNADKVINYSLSGDPQSLDPQIASDMPSIIAVQALFEGLTRLDANGGATPGVAKSWTANDENTEFTFLLRTDAKWSNGKEVTAQDFVYAFQRALSPATGSTTCSSMYCIQNAKAVHSGQMTADQLGVKAVDDHTLVVDLEYSYADFPALTASTPFMPCNQEFFESTAGRYGLEKKYILGNGPFAIDGAYGWQHGSYMKLKRSSSYSGETEPLPSAVNFTISDAAEADVSADPVAALENGTVDAAAVSADQAEKIEENGGTLASYMGTTWGLCFNTQSDYFKNENVRKAFIQVLDRPKMLSHISDDSKVAADNILLPDTTLFGKSFREMAGGPYYLTQDANAAMTLAQGISELGLKQMKSITVLCPDDADTKLMANEMISAWNASFGTYFNMQPLDKNSLISQVNSGNFQAAIYPLSPKADGPLAVLSLFGSSTSENPAKLNDPAYDALIANAENESEEQAVSDYITAEKYLNENAIFYPLYYEKSYYAMAKGVTGIVFYSYQGGVDFINAGKD